MAMDYKHRVPSNRNRRLQKPKSKSAWIAAAVAAAAILIVWVIFRGNDVSAPESEEPKTTQLQAPPISPLTKPEEKIRPAKPEAKTAEPERKPEQPAPPPEPRFSFYKILPEKEVIIPESEIRTIKRAESLGNTPAGEVYLLQAGSFPNLQDAEKLKAQLAQLKVKAKIENVKIENTLWHRVKIGPFDSLVSADKVRVYLRSNQIDSVVQKARSK